MDKKFFTLVFEGDIGQFPANPFLTETPFGRPFACGRGNALDEGTRGCCSYCKDPEECVNGCRAMTNGERT